MELTPRTRGGRIRALLDGAAALAMIAASAAIVWLAFIVPPLLKSGVLAGQGQAAQGRPAETLPSKPLPIEGAAVKGQAGARVAVIEYSDFQCPFCGTFARDTLPDLVTKYVDSGRVLFAFRHMPLDAIHPHARRAAEAAECGRRQERFWEVHDALFRSPEVFEKFNPVSLRIDGLDQSRFEKCLGGEAADTIKRDAAEARALGIRGTPTFFFGVLDDAGKNLRVTRRESGAIPIEAFAAILEKTIEKGGAARARR